MATKRYVSHALSKLEYSLTTTVIKIKKDLIHKAKVKKEYAKIKSREPPVDRPIPHTTDEQKVEEPATQELHPDRQAMLDEPREASPPPRPQREFRPPQEGSERPARPERRDRNRNRKPGYFDKDLDFAQKQKKEAEEKQAEFERRQKEKKEKIEERERFRKAMAKARTGGKNGQRKLGRESKVLLERVQRLVQE